MIVLPAYAGMILIDIITPIIITRAPRIRGDDPPYKYAGEAHRMCSPHTRG